MPKAKDSPSRPPGRPAGAKTRKPPVVTVAASRCRKCQSTERTRYSKTLERATAGVDRDGLPYTHVVRRWTRCRKCGQARIDRSCENRIEAPPETVSIPFPARPKRVDERPDELRPAA